MGIECADFTKVKGEIAGDYDGFFAIGKFIVEIASKISIFGLIGGGSAHVGFPFDF